MNNIVYILLPGTRLVTRIGGWAHRDPSLEWPYSTSSEQWTSQCRESPHSWRGGRPEPTYIQYNIIATHTHTGGSSPRYYRATVEAG